jgi:hypothetical protein
VYVQGPPPGYVQAPPPGYVQAPPPGYIRAPEQASDGVRFRGGIFLDAGGLIASGANDGMIGPHGELGVQINNLVGIYATPGFGILFGASGGLDIGTGLMADFTILNDVLTVGGGLDLGAFAAFGSTSALAGAGYGGRIHVAWNAIVSKGENGYRRKALVLALDLRFIVGPGGSASTGGCSVLTAETGGCNPAAAGASASGSEFFFFPVASLGYSAF